MKSISKSMSDAAIAGVLFERLEAIRIRKQIKQQEIADEIGITPKTYRNLKTGKASVSTLLLVLRRLGLLENLQLLVPETTISPIEMQMIEQASKRPRRARQVVTATGNAQAEPAKMFALGNVSESQVRKALLSRKKIKKSASKESS